MNTIEKIRTEIGKHLDALNKVKHLATFAEEHGYNHGFEDAMRDLLSFLDTLEESDRPEPYNPVYDEAYLNEKIAKATKSWKGVDVDAMLAECRGYEEKSEIPTNVDLEKEISRHINKRWKLGRVNPATPVYLYDFTVDELKECARHFYELGRNAK